MAYKRFDSVKEWAVANGVTGRSATLAALWSEHRRLLDAIDYLEKEDMEFIKREYKRLKNEVANLRIILDGTALKLDDSAQKLSRLSAELRKSATDSIKAEDEAVRNRADPAPRVRIDDLPPALFRNPWR